MIELDSTVFHLNLFLHLLKQVQSGFRSNAQEPDQERIGKLLREAQSRLSFLRIVTPRDARVSSDEPEARLVYQDGAATDASKVSVSCAVSPCDIR